jgi:hypothetical protein
MNSSETVPLVKVDQQVQLDHCRINNTTRSFGRADSWADGTW